MIVTEIITIGDKQYKCSYSDSGHYIEHDGRFYEKALEDVNSKIEFTETELKIEAESGEVLSFDDVKRKADLFKQSTINNQQDEMLAEIYEIILGGTE